MIRVKNGAIYMYYFAMLPALMLWMAVSIVALYTYIIKGVIFLITGSASIVGATGPVAMVPKVIFFL
jgi:hypothetical protein